ncbi:type III pantothenate kinase [Robertkochia solimangrovi]|uniref:type III pantothenate kinase n=1 Tax=Robertkochia solimangrovi TaxID=2213046 RepID=UPI00117E2150|nr:type III pantothenate kinase [Robertkochia solimangrovi]TRZ43259.1 type III pantothenate kinase [Robertkochia solimangrovi]
MNLVIDVGNTFIKLAVFEGKRLVEVMRVDREELLKALKNIFEKFPEIRDALVSSVGKLSGAELKAIAVFCPFQELTPKSKVPFINRYGTPETLGMDRVALITAAYYNYKLQNCLVIDAGTCITYDFINKETEYLGGAISPGVRMRFKAMHEFTHKLPMIEDHNFNNIIGDSTKSSMISGVVHGTVKEIEGFIADYKVIYKDLTVILTGGDSHFLSKRLKSTIFAHSNFLLEGLNYILELNKR